MKTRLLVVLVICLSSHLLGACASEVLPSAGEGSGGRPTVPEPPAAGNGEAGEVGNQPGLELRVPVSAGEATFVRLSEPEVIELDGAASDDSLAWDLAFQGWNVFTNGGVSGPGGGWSFGPSEYYYLFFPDDVIDVPLPIPDRASGAFLGWYAYNGADHLVYSRFHVYGVRSSGRLYKLQVLGYRGQVQGTLLNALYRVRYAEVTPDGSGPLVDIGNIDATANGDALNPDEPSTCLDLATAEQLALTPREAGESLTWDLCFRRDVITVSGGEGGPRGVEAVDLDAQSTAGESIEDLVERTASSELARFEETTHDTLTAPGLDYRGDVATSAFSGRWYVEGDPRTPVVDKSWLVVGPDGESRYYLAFTAFENASADSPGTVVLRVQAVRP